MQHRGAVVVRRHPPGPSDDAEMHHPS